MTPSSCSTLSGLTFPNCPRFDLFVRVIAWPSVKEIQVDCNGLEGWWVGAQEDEEGAGRGAEGTRSQDRRKAALLKQQTTRKETGPAPDRPAQCMPKRFPLISVQRRQGRDSKRLAWGWRRGLVLAGFLQKGTSLLPGVHKSYEQIASREI